MVQYHISTSGQPAVCRAQSQASCPRGQHFSSVDTAAFHLEMQALIERARTASTQVPREEDLPMDPHTTALGVAANEFLTAHGTLAMENWGDDDTYGKTVTLAQFADGNIARNNCYNIARTILAMTPQPTFGGEALQAIAVANEDVYHAALAVWVEDDWYVVDYSARQFDEKLPFPYVAQQEIWKSTIDERNEAYTAFCADAGDPSSFEDDEDWADEED